MRRCGLVVLTLGCAVLALCPAAFGSQLIDRNPSGLTLQLSSILVSALSVGVG